jgi:hypothetical protein
VSAKRRMPPQSDFVTDVLKPGRYYFTPQITFVLEVHSLLRPLIADLDEHRSFLGLLTILNDLWNLAHDLMMG